MSDQVYICIPMYPEGDPSSDASQEILYWQHCTMAAMYQRVAAAIQAVGSEAHPQDYLNFYCLGKRESEQELPEGLDTPEEGSLVERVRQSLRHPVYVHSKLMVVDDTHIVLGSANINQRSLDGHRDSEICLHGHQPARGAAGGVRVFREALWAAHTGGRHPQLAEPGTQVRHKTVQLYIKHLFPNLYTSGRGCKSVIVSAVRSVWRRCGVCARLTGRPTPPPRRPPPPRPCTCCPTPWPWTRRARSQPSPDTRTFRTQTQASLGRRASFCLQNLQHR